MNKSMQTVEVGDVVVIAGHRVGDVERIGEILEVRSHELYRVRWEDGRESLFAPGSDATIKHPTQRRRSRTAKV